MYWDYSKKSITNLEDYVELDNDEEKENSKTEERFIKKEKFDIETCQFIGCLIDRFIYFVTRGQAF